MKNSYSTKNWYVPLKIAIQDLNIEQVNWKDSSGNHSIGELVSHIIFWNDRVLTNFQGGKNKEYDNDNEATFIKYSTQEWSKSLSRIDSIQKEMETALKNADKKQLMKWDTEINNMCSHMAYHTGQIVYIQKMKGWWVEAKTVK